VSIYIACGTESLSLTEYISTVIITTEFLGTLVTVPMHSHLAMSDFIVGVITAFKHIMIALKNYRGDLSIILKNWLTKVERVSLCKSAKSIPSRFAS
jgi:hypothetical protein